MNIDIPQGELLVNSKSELMEFQKALHQTVVKEEAKSPMSLSIPKELYPKLLSLREIIVLGVFYAAIGFAFYSRKESWMIPYVDYMNYIVLSGLVMLGFLFLSISVRALTRFIFKYMVALNHYTFQRLLGS